MTASRILKEQGQWQRAGTHGLFGENKIKCYAILMKTGTFFFLTLKLFIDCFVLDRKRAVPSEKELGTEGSVGEKWGCQEDDEWPKLGVRWPCRGEGAGGTHVPCPAPHPCPCPEAGPTLDNWVWSGQSWRPLLGMGEGGTLRQVIPLNGCERNDKYWEGCGLPQDVPESLVFQTHFGRTVTKVRGPLLFLPTALLLYFSAKP